MKTQSMRADVRAAMNDGLSALVSEGPDTESLRWSDARYAAAASDFGVFDPHDVYVLEASDAPPSEDNAVKSAVRVFVGEPTGEAPAAAAEVTLTPEGSVIGFSRLLRGRMVNGLWKALQVAERLPELEDHDPRVLEVPQLYVSALWLSAQDPNEDLFIPLVEGGAPLEPLQPYRRPEFASALRRARESRTDEPFPI